MQGAGLQHYADTSNLTTKLHSQERKNQAGKSFGSKKDMIVIADHSQDSKGKSMQSMGTDNDQQILSGELSFKQAVLPMIQNNQATAFGPRSKQ